MEPLLNLTPPLRRVLRAVAFSEPVTAREVALNANMFEAKARSVLKRLAERGLVRWRSNDGVVHWRVTAQGREAVAQMGRERVASGEQEALLAAADPASLVTCPACGGRRVYCQTCAGCRLVTAEQAAEAPAA